VYLTASDSGRSVTVRVGTRIDLTLAPYGGSFDPPTVDNPTELSELTHHGGYPSDTPAVSDWKAVAPGTAHLSSQSDLACLHTTPACLPPQFEFRVTIIVT
jgi:hypothetical protein